MNLHIPRSFSMFWDYDNRDIIIAPTKEIRKRLEDDAKQTEEES